MTTLSERLAKIVKTYDIRGLVGTELDGPTAAALGWATGAVMKKRFGATEMVIGNDMRESGKDLSAAFTAGLQVAGLNVIRIGLCSTDQLYFASGKWKLPGAMFTASHNPASYNGIKLCGPGAAGISWETGLREIAELAAGGDGLPTRPHASQLRDESIAWEYAWALRTLSPLPAAGRKLKIVVDAGNGMAGLIVPQVFSGAAGHTDVNIDIEPMYFELDGSFPNHEANPLDPANLRDLQARVPRAGADAGLAFDGDADRCFLVDERGEAISPSAIAALVAKQEIERAKANGDTAPVVLHNLICSRAVSEVITEAGGTPVRTRVGHSLIKDEMRRTGAVFAGEHSAHYYFRDFYNADSGMLAALNVLAMLASGNEPLSAVVAPFNRYSASGEINSRVSDAGAAVASVRAASERGEFGSAACDELDGLTVSGTDGSWWFNVRASNTEPLLRLNAETSTHAQTRELTARVLDMIRS